MSCGGPTREGIRFDLGLKPQRVLTAADILCAGGILEAGHVQGLVASVDRSVGWRGGRCGPNYDTTTVSHGH
jgi:hypothetical protein